MAKEYVCENCGYKGDHYKSIKWNNAFALSMYAPFLVSLSGTKLTAVCPQCNMETIKLDPLDMALVPGSIPGKKWTTKSLFVLIFVVVFVLIVLPTLASIYLK